MCTYVRISQKLSESEFAHLLASYQRSSVALYKHSIPDEGVHMYIRRYVAIHIFVYLSSYQHLSFVM